MTAFSERGKDNAFNGTEDTLADDTLFEVDVVPRVTLHDRFIVPPFSVLDRRAGYWQDRRRRWMNLGIRSEVGRDDHLTFRASLQDVVDEPIETTSIFDPVVCELAYRWYCAPDAQVLDPFAGGSVRGIVASCLERWYTGIELRKEQVLANAEQAHLGNENYGPLWIPGDSVNMDNLLPRTPDFDLIFSCPPYADLEIYSDDPADLSNMPYPNFLHLYTRVIEHAYTRLRDNRFAIWVISDVRDRKTGLYRGLVSDTHVAFKRAGFELYNDCILVDPVNTASVRAPVTFGTHRKQARVHQHVMVYVKGDPRKAAAYAKGLEEDDE